MLRKLASHLTIRNIAMAAGLNVGGRVFCTTALVAGRGVC